MSFTISNYIHNFKQLTPQQKKTILIYILLLNVFLLCSVSLFGYKLSQIKQDEIDYISERIDVPPLNESQVALVKDQIAVDTQIFMWNTGDINLKEKTVPVDFYVRFVFKSKDFNGKAPEFDIFNGKLRSSQLINHREDGNNTVELYRVDADIEPQLMLQMYPLDQELLSVRITPTKIVSSNYYFKLTAFQDHTEKAQTNYDLNKIGFVNMVVDYKHELAQFENSLESNVNYLGVNRAYMLFEHKSILSYIKSIQYILLSVCIAVFSLLINTRTNSPKNGRVAVIGSSVFSLAANVFQLNATTKSINAITAIDLMTFFCGVIIVLCYLITVRTLRFLDDDSYAMAKIFDQSMFMLTLTYSIIFFSAVYLISI